MTTLFDVILCLSDRVVQPHRGVSTDTGTTTTLIDKDTTTQDGYFNEGTLLIQTGTYLGTFHKVTKYLSTGTFTIATAVAGNIPSGVRYQAVPIPLDDMIAAVNGALREIGLVLAEDSTLTVVPGQYEYTLPSGVSDVRKIEDIISDIPVEKNRWTEIAGKIRFDVGFQPMGDNIRLTYKAKHAFVSTASASISSYLDINWVAVRSAILLIKQKLIRTGDRRKYEQLLSQLEWEEVTLRNPTPDMPIVRLARW